MNQRKWLWTRDTDKENVTEVESNNDYGNEDDEGEAEEKWEIGSRMIKIFLDLSFIADSV